MGARRSWIASSLAVSGLAIALLALHPSPAVDRAALDTPPSSVTDLCLRHTTAERGSFIRMLHRAGNMLDIMNTGGYFDQGTCWWHSRLQRAATYLAYYSPRKPKPTPSESSEIVRHLAAMDRVVEIPGYRNLILFAMDHHAEIQAELNRWQERDSFSGAMKSINPFRRSAYTSDPHMMDTLDELKIMLERYHVVPLVMLQVPGLSAHAWTIIDVKRVYRDDADYEIKYLDSNVPLVVQTTTARRGDEQLFNEHVSKKGFAPYIDWMGDFDRIGAAVKKACPTLYIGSYYPKGD